MPSKFTVSYIATIVATLFFLSAKAQQQIKGTAANGAQYQSIQVGVPFLLIAPDARAAGMGDSGVATTPDENSIHWNPAKMAFIESTIGVNLSYAPWLRSLTSDTNLSYLSTHYHIDERNTIGLSLRYFTLGTIQLTDSYANSLGTYKPTEFAFDAAFARRFNSNFSIGIAIRFISSDFKNNQFNNNQQTHAATGFGADVSSYYKQEATLFGKKSELSAGINISNIGSKISYQTNGGKYNLPTNLRLGGAAGINIDTENKLNFSIDLNKLLVPDGDVSGSNSSVGSSIFESFSNAGGLRTISCSLGAEYWLKQQFALRLGYFYEDPIIGNRQFGTTGAGFRYKSFELDVAYILASPQTTPLAQTLRFTVGINFQNSDNERNNPGFPHQTR